MSLSAKFEKSKRRLRYKTVGVFLILLFLAPIFPISADGVPDMFSYQGRLYDAGGNLLGGDGTIYYFKFSIWDSPAGGTKLWPASSLSTMAINVEYGVFSVNIGDISAGGDILDLDFTDEPYYLQVEAASQSNFSDGETLLPRQQVVSSGYSINADTLDSFHASTTPAANEIPVLDSLGNLNIAGLINNTEILGGTLAGGFYSGNSIIPESDFEIGDFAQSLSLLSNDINLLASSTLDTIVEISNLNPSAYSNLDIRGQVAIGSFSSPPIASMREGALYYNSNDETVFFWNGTSWVDVVGDGGPSATATLQSAYDFSSTPATINVVGGKDVVWNLFEDISDANFIVNFGGNNNAFMIQNNGIPILSVRPSGNFVFRPLIPNSDSFQVQDALGIPILNINSLDSRIHVGNGAGTAEPSLLILDTKNTTGDPICINGAMYYSSFLEKMRICENNTWKNLEEPSNTKTFITLHAPTKLEKIINPGATYVDFSSDAGQTTVVDFTSFTYARISARMRSQKTSGEACLRIFNITDSAQLGDEVCVTGKNTTTAVGAWQNISLTGDKEIKLQIHDNNHYHDPRVGLVILELK